MPLPKKIFYFALFLTVSIFIPSLPFLLPANPSLPSFNELGKNYKPSEAVLLDRNGAVIHEMRVDFTRRRLRWTRLKDISPAFLKFVLQLEDKRFYEHGGVDYRAMASALYEHLIHGKKRGASTITMQLVSLLDPNLKAKGLRRTIGQKILQLKAAIEIEQSWSKEEILEAYLNLISYRGELEGIGSASQGLFKKTPNGLNDKESLILASLIPAPNASVETVGARACQASVTLGMNDVISQKVEGDSYLKKPPLYPLLRKEGESGGLPQPYEKSLNSHCEAIMATVRNHLGNAYSIRLPRNLAPHVAGKLLSNGKLEVRSTIDEELQRVVMENLRQVLHALKRKNVTDGAVLAVDNETCEVLAYVANSGKTSPARYVDGIMAKRQAGSTLKPFLYGLAMDERILTPASLLKDVPLNFPTPMGIYRPKNYDNHFKGLVTLRPALASSFNIPAVRVASLMSPERFVSKLRELGFQNLRDGGYYGVSIALGTADVSLWELVNAYRVLANHGDWTPLRLTFSKENHAPKKIFSEGAAFLVSHILSDKGARSATFSLNNPLSTKFWSAVKTGTSKNMRDNWCVGFSEKYTLGVWVGNFSGEPMRNVSGITGAAPLWYEIMNTLHKVTPSRPPSPPESVIKKKVNFMNTGSGREEYFLRGTESEKVLPITVSPNPKITYPSQGAVIALDPDIPLHKQKILFEAQGWVSDLKWTLDGEEIGSSALLAWEPRAGTQRLAIRSGGKMVDQITFFVRD